MVNTIKQCSDCKQEKEFILFPPDKRCLYGRAAKCRKCTIVAKKKYYSKYPEAEAERRRKNAECGRKWYRKNRVKLIEQMKWHRIKKVHGITKAEYESILVAQDRKCAICCSEEPGRQDRHFAVDHDHTTGKIRGLLCQKCNCGIGLLKDDIYLLEKALIYLRKHHDR